MLLKGCNNMEKLLEVAIFLFIIKEGISLLAEFINGMFDIINIFTKRK